METTQHRVRISGEICHKYEQVIELSDEQLTKFRNRLNTAKRKGHQAIDDYLGEDYGDTDPIDWEYNEWSAELLDNKDSVIEYLDH